MKTTTLCDRSLFGEAAAVAAIMLLLVTGPTAWSQPLSTSTTELDILGEILARSKDAGIPEAELEDFIMRGRTAGLTDEQISVLSLQILRMADEGLPYRPLLDRARQGLAKGAAFERMERVCSVLERRLRDGAELVDASFPETGSAPLHEDPVFAHRLELIDHTAFALEKGVPPATLASVFSGLTGEAVPRTEAIASMSGAVVALTSLTSEGVPPEKGLGFVMEAFQRGVHGPNLKELGLAVGHALGAEGSNGEFLKQILRRLEQGTPPGQIIQDLQKRRMAWLRGKQPFPNRDGIRGRSGGRRGQRNGPPDDPGRRGRRDGRSGGTGRP
jgi:hypothetical protein